MTNENKKKETKITPQSLVTEKYVKAALVADKGEEAELTSWAVVDFTKRGDNYASVVTSVKAKFLLKGRESEVVYVVKANPCRYFEEYEEFWHMLFVKELKFYMTMLPELNSALRSSDLGALRVPQCYAGTLDNARELIFLEDLRARDFKMFDRMKGMDVAHAKLVLQELGRFHASSLVLNERKGGGGGSSGENYFISHGYLKKDWLSTEDGGSGDAIRKLFEGYIDNAVAMLEKVGGYERAIAWAKGLKPQVPHILGDKMISDRCNVVCHGDCWNNNVLFRYNEEGSPEEVMLLDLQFCRYASPATDLNYLLYTSVEGHIRKIHMESFLSLYYASFKDTLEAGGMLDVPFTEDELRQEFAEKRIIGALFAMTIVPLLLLESDEVPDLATEKGDVGELMDEIRAKALDVVENSPLLKPRFLSMFEEFMELGLIE